MENKYCIIGAGFCGLGVAKAFLDLDITFDWYEKNDDVGGNWLNGVYDSTHIISSRDTTAYREFPMPADYPDFPSRTQILNYLRAYAEHFGLREHIRFNTEVSRVRPLNRDGMDGWSVELANGEKKIYRGVVVANGHHWDKRHPNYPGTFTGKTLHSKDYKNAGDLEGNRVLVVGAGNSGCDISVEAAEKGFTTHMSIRRGYYFLPKTIFGVPTAEIDRPGVPIFAQKLALRMATRLMLGPNSRYGIPKPDHALFDHHPIVNSQLPYAIRHGKVKIVPDIERLNGKTVHFKDGSQLEVDTIVWATGFKVSFPFLDQKLFEWENGIPKRVASMMPVGVAGLYIYGLAQPRGGGGPLISESADILARMILLQEQLDHPLARDLVRFQKPSARMLIGVTEAKREMRLGRLVLKYLIKRNRAAPARDPLPILPRKPAFNFKGDIPRYWFFESALGTHVVNGLNLLFPEGERYFIRSVAKFSDQIKKPELRAKVKAFSAQEIKHGNEHERYFEALKRQGFSVDGFLKWYTRIVFDGLERIYPAKLNLAMTAAFEHYTATFAERCLRDRYFHDHAHSAVAELFIWHGIEEIEHKSVAYDVLQEIAPSYALRLAGLLIASLQMLVLWNAAAYSFVRQDKNASAGRLIRETIEAVRGRRLFNGDFVRAFAQFASPRFHPSQLRNEGLAKQAMRYLERRRTAASAPVSSATSARPELAAYQ